MAVLREIVPALGRGMIMTLEITAMALIVALAAAFAAGLLRLSPWRPVRAVVTAYVEIVRGTSLLVQLFWLYFALPMLLDVHMPAMTAAVLALGLNYGAYGSEVVRSSMIAVPQGQREAATALNMTPWLRLRRIILPQALPLMLPSFGNLQIELLKGTSLVYFITLTDLTYQGMLLRTYDSSQTAAIFVCLLVMYFLLSALLTLLLRAFGRRIAWRRS
ncbi:ectoine/hydroxyectoine ABC transporter permease subunit EhuC [Paenibacillus athensensis]|uniref:Ectoine/hydroxyectoine ABC transporter permease subunit EhuC n=1 Tax=Paenibacillus athensensis TaxID=1967502 RepID=A0A4Y8Q051_9BACL|nr:ectoine/hydroxyectoine ABC transporter permease subunit EhuC [Paenibacillus athensensis]MCD1261091.1 ectoine/hydroxyectoine ABC transporter permease subunit EhuC [Paenibacillus athensensis]